MLFTWKQRKTFLAPFHGSDFLPFLYLILSLIEAFKFRGRILWLKGSETRVGNRGVFDCVRLIKFRIFIRRETNRKIFLLRKNVPESNASCGFCNELCISQVEIKLTFENSQKRKARNIFSDVERYRGNVIIELTLRQCSSLEGRESKWKSSVVQLPLLRRHLHSAEVRMKLSTFSKTTFGTEISIPEKPSEP